MRPRLSALSAVLPATLALQPLAASEVPSQPDRTVLPIAARPFAGAIDPSLARSRPDWSPPATAPAGAPNVLLVLTDDVGFAASSTFGGPVPTPNLDRLAAMGARYRNFHTTGMCSPTRAALLTGRSHHAVSVGALTDTAMGFPGYTGEMPATSATIARVLQANGYATAMFGKHHDVPGDESGPTGPFMHWPTGLGFDHFYGFIGAETDQWHPTLYDGTTAVSNAGRDPGLILDRDLVDHAIHWIDQQAVAQPGRPFFLYWAPGSTHSPHQAPADWIAQFKGRFDQGWDALRQQSFARQVALGLFPRATRLSPRTEGIPAWNSLDADHRRLFARYMEVYAAMLAYEDAQFGRLLDELDRTGQLQNTLVVFVEGDNGASGEGSPEGTTNEMMRLAGLPDQGFAEQLANIDRLGGPDQYMVYPAGWAWALNAPFPYFKQIASHLGGTRNGMVMAWPGHVTHPEQIRGQFAHVNDIMPTILEAAGVPAPQTVDGARQDPLDGFSLVYTFTAPAEPTRHRTQYFEMFGNRAIYRDGWLVSSVPGRLPWERRSPAPPEQFAWSLYNLSADPAQAVDLAAREPARLAEMRALFDQEAQRNHVYPLRADLDPILTPALMRPHTPRTHFVFRGKDLHLAFANQPLLWKGFTITCDLVLPEHANGAVVATGSTIGGWSFYLRDGVPMARHSASSAAADSTVIAGPGQLPAGPARLVYRFEPDARTPGAGGRLSLAVDGKPVAEAHLARIAFMTAGNNETFDVGNDAGRPAADYGAGPEFTGTIDTVKIETAP